MSGISFRFCDERGADGFGWIAEEAMARTSHALAADGKVWLVDALDWPDAIERALGLGDLAGVLQLLDRHNRDCGALAERLAVPHLVAPDEIPGSPFIVIPIVRRKRWQERALWWPERRTLVVAEAVGTNRFFTGGKALLGVHLLLRLTPPRKLAAYEPVHLLTGHGVGVHGDGAAETLRETVRTSRRGLPGLLIRIPFVAR